MNCFRLPVTVVSLVALCGSVHAEAPRPAMKDFLGICTHTIQFKPDLYQPICSLARDYHPVEWDLGARTEVLPEFPFAKNKVDWEQVYSAWAKGKFRTDVSLMFDSIPPDRWHDLESDSAAYASAFAGRFGPSGRTPLVESIEIGNEPGNYSDAQYAAILRSAVPAARKADAKIRIATCNLTTGHSTRYSKSVATLLAAPEALKQLDVLTIHTYAEAEPWPTWRRSFPEDPSLKYLTDVTNLARWRDDHAPGKSLWITEFGYDSTTQKPDPKKEFSKWVGVTDTQQAQYLVRSALLFAAMPVDRAYIYFFNDKDEPMLHSSSGVTRNFQPKPAYHALAHLQSTLGNYHFSRVVAHTAGEINAYEFTRADCAGRSNHRGMVPHRQRTQSADGRYASAKHADRPCPENAIDRGAAGRCCHTIATRNSRRGISNLPVCCSAIKDHDPPRRMDFQLTALPIWFTSKPYAPQATRLARAADRSASGRTGGAYMDSDGPRLWPA